MAERAIIARLKAHAGTAALVSDRVYGAVAPQNVANPYITLFRVSTDRPSAMGADIGIARARIQVNAWSNTYASAKSVSAQIRDALQRYTGTSGTVVVLDIFMLTEQDMYEPDTQIHHIAVDVETIFRE